MGGVPTRSIVRAGLLGGAGAIYVALVGLYTKFADLELVGEQITLGRVLIVAPAFVAAFAVTRPRVVAGERRSVELRGGLAVGAVSALVGGAALLRGDLVRRLVRRRPDPRGLRRRHRTADRLPDVRQGRAGRPARS